MTYEQALAYLASLNKFGMNFGLERIEKLTALMGHPERRFKTVHVTGTNGKGSTAAMLAAVFKAAGIRAALYTSPHLSSYTERFVVDGRQAGEGEFAAAVEFTGKIVDKMVAAGFEHPTEFEVLTAAAFYFFAAAGVEYAVIEVGLGGLLDSTNVVMPELAVITNVALEHTDRCGGTVAEIAGHKAGIIKPGVPVVTAAQGEALAVILRQAAKLAAPAYVLDRDFSVAVKGFEGYRQIVGIITRDRGSLGNFLVNLAGRHQAENSAVAVMAALILGGKDGRITPAAVREALATVFWPGRFEILAGEPATIIDSAHNPAGALALRTTLDEMFPGRRIAFLVGFLADKDVRGITDLLIRPDDDAVIVRPLSERAANPAEVAGVLVAGRVATADSIAGGYEKVRAFAGPGGIVCAAGSLYLTGPFRELAVDK